jgi:hypothetical protein
MLPPAHKDDAMIFDDYIPTPEEYERRRRIEAAHYNRPMDEIIGDVTPKSYWQLNQTGTSPAPQPPLLPSVPQQEPTYRTPLAPVGIRQPTDNTSWPNQGQPQAPTWNRAPVDNNPWTVYNDPVEAEQTELEQPWLYADIPKPGEQWSEKLGRWMFSPIIKHYSRNRLNRPELARTPLEPKDAIYHTFYDEGQDNTKFISPDGRYEAVRNPDGTDVTHPANIATYNRASKDEWFGVPHFFKDMLPYYLLGNSPQDPTTTGQRIRRWFEE